MSGVWLGIETSCDETAAAVVRGGREVLSSLVHSQIPDHEAYGGVVPEIACRAHVEVLPGMVRRALHESGVGWDDLAGIAVTAGPGLASSLMVGVSFARGLSMQTGLPLAAVNHLEGHLLSLFLDPSVPAPETACPLVVLLVSGGHSGLALMSHPGEYQWLGGTLDDAAGEALDKGAKCLGLGYPGGPIIERVAQGGDPDAISFPRGLRHGATRSDDRRYDLSFSGLKTALLYHVRGLARPPEGTALANVCASYQEAVVDALASRLEMAVADFAPRGFACVGGVAKNRRLRERLDALSVRERIPLYLAPLAYCTDNAAMIAAAAGLRSHPAGVDFDIHPSCGMKAFA